MRTTKKQTVSTWVPTPIADRIQRLIDEGRYVNSADFIWAAVREKLEKELRAE